MSDWYLLRGDKTLGPYRAEDLRAWAGEGRLLPTDLLAPVGGEQWQPIGAWPDLSSGPVSVAAAIPQPAAPLREDGLSEWITRGWQMASTDVGVFIGATCVVLLLSILSLGICAPPLNAGLYRMVLRKHDGHPIEVNDVFGGFRYFAVAWGFNLLVSLPMFLVLGLLIGLIFVLGHSGRAGIEETMPVVSLIVQGPMMVISYFIATVILFGMPLIVDREFGAIDALVGTWEAVKPRFWSLLLANLIFQFIVSGGAMLCGIGMLFTLPLSLCCIVATYRTYFPAKAG